MRQPDQREQGLFGNPPEGRSKPDTIEQQGERLGGHDNKGRQRYRDHIGERAVQPRLVKMKQRDRGQRNLDDQSGDQQSRHAASHTDRDGLFPPGEKGTHRPTFMQRDDRGDRCKAELEAWPGKRLGSPDHDDQRPRRNEPQGQGLPAQEESDEHEQRGDERRRAHRVRVADDADVAPRARHGHVQAPLVREEAHDFMRVRPRQRQHDGVALASLIPVDGLAVDGWREHGSQ